MFVFLGYLTLIFLIFFNQHLIRFLNFKLNWMLKFVLTVVLFCIITQFVALSEGGDTKV